MSDRKIIHLANRLSLGLKKGKIDDIKNKGISGYINSQLNPAAIPIPEQLQRQLQPLNTLPWKPGKLVFEQNRIVNEAKKLDLNERSLQKVRRQFQQRVINQARLGRLIRALHSPRELEEVMVDFWFNHFNVFGMQGLARIWIGSYEEQAIRPHVLGKFRTLLGATAHHPAMLVYLDNWQNTAPGSPGATGRFKGLNENYARELLELHTLGVDGGYAQKDVVELARILTGWGLPKPSDRARDEDGFYFDETRHDFDDKILLGKTIKGRGIEEVEEAAINAFFRQGLYRTRDANGVLLFISVFEHKVWLLADQGIHEKVPQAEWDALVARITRGIREGHRTDAICSAIETIGQLLETHFPVKPDDTDELKNLIVGEG